ncbi:hypothetical protein DERP_009425 [Dermatophagoides pteronyssinus]|uniref:Uncharacterized protein n=1 Tax=Dermatophagoides pteronyssinus TaxID=6956 RepID=A0ABQ8IU39_DERPT|nr:hypothetical protein DERP_009425 [Dermatophagoides pteronyssinus]
MSELENGQENVIETKQNTNLSVKIGSIELPEAQLTLQSRKPLGLQTVILKRPKFARNISKCLSFKHDNSN